MTLTYMKLLCLQVAKVVGRQKNSLSYSYRQSFSLTSMGVYLFEGACK